MLRSVCENLLSSSVVKPRLVAMARCMVPVPMMSKLVNCLSAVATEDLPLPISPDITIIFFILSNLFYLKLMFTTGMVALMRAITR